MPPSSESTGEILSYGQALAAAIRAFDTLLPHASPFERLLLRLLRAAYQRRLRALILALPGDVADQILTGQK